MNAKLVVAFLLCKELVKQTAIIGLIAVYPHDSLQSLSFFRVVNRLRVVFLSKVAMKRAFFSVDVSLNPHSI